MIIYALGLVPTQTCRTKTHASSWFDLFIVNDSGFWTPPRFFIHFFFHFSLFLSPQDFPTGYEGLPMGFPAGFEAFPAGSEAFPAGSEALLVEPRPLQLDPRPSKLAPRPTQLAPRLWRPLWGPPSLLSNGDRPRSRPHHCKTNCVAYIKEISGA